MRFKIFVLSCLLLGLTSCSTVKVADYANNVPSLIPETFFKGSMTAHGVVKNRSGKMIRYFNATIDASWRDGIGTLDEHFVFDDGEEQQRIWILTPTSAGFYRATAGDVIGDGEAQVAGNAMFLNYVLRVPYNDGTIDLRIDDRMYLVNEQTLINQSTMFKFGFKVGSITLTILKTD